MIIQQMEIRINNLIDKDKFMRDFKNYLPVSPFLTAFTALILTWFLDGLSYWLTESVWVIILISGLCVVTAIGISFVQFQNNVMKQQEALQKNYEQSLSRIRHDVRGILSPALLMADRITQSKNVDATISQTAEAIAQSIEQVSTYLTSTKTKNQS